MANRFSAVEPHSRAAELAALPGRTVLGIAGAPGAGKSTIAAELAAAVPGAVVVPRVGFHRTTADLRARGWVAERGTPRTCDADAFVAALRSLRDGAALRWPAFDRAREEPVPLAIEVPAGAPLVIVEGNYLLLDTSPWHEVSGLLDECWFVEVAEPVRLARLIDRHVRFGRTRAEATARARAGSDADNARSVAATRSRADAVIAGS
jgi:pantothenate kinase